MVIPLPEEGVRGAPDPVPGGLGFPVCGPFPALGSRTQRDVVTRGYSVSYSPSGRAMGVSAGSQRKQDRRNREERRVSLKRVWGHPLPGAEEGGSRTLQRPPNLRHSFPPSTAHPVAKTPPDFRGLELRWRAWPPRSAVMCIWVNLPPLGSRGCSPLLSSLLPPGAGASSSLGPRCSEWRSSSEWNM